MHRACAYPIGDNEQASRGQGPGAPATGSSFPFPRPTVLGSRTHLAGPHPSEKQSLRESAAGWGGTAQGVNIC